MDNDFEMRRGERRSFYCPNKLWYEVLKATDDCFSVSLFIRKAIIEKLIKDNPEKNRFLS